MVVNAGTFVCRSDGEEAGVIVNLGLGVGDPKVHDSPVTIHLVLVESPQEVIDSCLKSHDKVELKENLLATYDTTSCLA